MEYPKVQPCESSRMVGVGLGVNLVMHNVPKWLDTREKSYSECCNIFKMWLTILESLNISSGISGILYFGISGISGIPYLQSHWHFFHLKTFVFEESKLYLYLSINISNQRVNIRSNTD